MAENETSTPTDFIREAVAEDLRSGRFNTVHTRFPPEPNGYLHIGHAKAFVIDFGMAKDFGGKCNLRYDDTNPTKEDVEYVDAIKEDIHWLGFDWEEREYYASDYFPQLYQWAVELIKKGKAYVDELSFEQMREYRGTLTEPGRNSPFRDRSIEENLDLFERMKNGEFPDGSLTLRSKIDMASPNVLLRDPVMYRIIHNPPHHRHGNTWCIYPMYDYAHGQSDSLEGITHSLCSLEYENHRPLYEWFLNELGIYAPRQIEFARLNLNYTVMSKRKLIKLVQEKLVRGWDDPRMPTLSGMRRRGFPAESILEFLNRVGVAKNYNVVDVSLLEEVVRDRLNCIAPRKMGVLKPLKLVIDNYPEGQVEEMEAVNNPEDSTAGTRKVPFSKVLYIDQDDFRAEAPPKYYRLTPGREVRLRYAYFVTCTGFETGPDGSVTTVHATYDPATRGGDAPDGRKVKSTIHWLSAAHAVPAEIRLYDRLFMRPNPEDVDEDSQTFLDFVNPNSLEILTGFVEPGLKAAQIGERFQFERQGYFNVDKDSLPGKLVFNRTVPLKDSWAKVEKNQAA